MKYLWNKAFLLGLIGFVLGILTGAGFMIIGYVGKVQEETIQSLVWYFVVCGIYGAFAMGSSVVYEIEHWSITRCTVIHFLSVFIAYTIVGLSQRWFSLNDPEYYIIMAVMIAVYFIIWLVQYMKYKRQVDLLNENLREWKKRHED